MNQSQERLSRRFFELQQALQIPRSIRDQHREETKLSSSLQPASSWSQFLQSAADLLGGEVASEELHELAGIVYDSLHDMKMNKRAIENKRQQLKELFGFVKEEHIQRTGELSQVASFLTGIRERAAGRYPSRARLRPRPATSSPARTSAPQQEAGEPEPPRAVPGETSINLRWLQSICASEEVAFAVCRVLDSLETGEQARTSLKPGETLVLRKLKDRGAVYDMPDKEVKLTLAPEFVWNGAALRWWMLVEDS